MENNNANKPGSNNRQIIMRSALITPDNYWGVEEWYMKVFDCPKCKTKSPISGSNFCRGCGVPVKMSKTVADYNKTGY